jgi:hypothetical protein
MAHRCSALPIKSRTTYGTHLLDHLPTHGAGFAAGQVAVVALLEVDADLIGGLHLELLHALLGLGDVDAVAGRIVVAHDRSLLFLSELWVPWEYYVPEKDGYDWRLAERVGDNGRERLLQGNKNNINRLNF